MAEKKSNLGKILLGSLVLLATAGGVGYVLYHHFLEEPTKTTPNRPDQPKNPPQGGTEQE